MTTYYLGTIPIIPLAFYKGEQALNKLYVGVNQFWSSADPVPTTLYGCTIGDSTIAAYLAQTAVPDLIAGYVSQTIADPGDTINAQLGLWNAISDYSDFETVIAEIGLNDITGTGTAVSAIGQLQNLVNQIRIDVPLACKIYVAKMLPCKSRWTTLFGANAPVAQQQWVDINNAIAGLGPTPITGVDGRVIDHVPLLDDGSGNLRTEYQVNGVAGDGIHPNNAGRQIIANAWRAKWVADGLLA